MKAMIRIKSVICAFVFALMLVLNARVGVLADSGDNKNGDVNRAKITQEQGFDTIVEIYEDSVPLSATPKTTDKLNIGKYILASSFIVLLGTYLTYVRFVKPKEDVEDKLNEM